MEREELQPAWSFLLAAHLISTCHLLLVHFLFQLLEEIRHLNLLVVPQPVALDSHKDKHSFPGKTSCMETALGVPYKTYSGRGYSIFESTININWICHGYLENRSMEEQSKQLNEVKKDVAVFLLYTNNIGQGEGSL